MEKFGLIALAVAAAGLALSWVVQRFNSRRGIELRLATDLMLSLVVVGILIWSAARAASHGGWFVAVAALLALTAAVSAVVSFFRAGALWMSLTGRFSEADYDD